MTHQHENGEASPNANASFKMPGRWRLIWCAVFFLPAAFFTYNGDIFAACLFGFTGIGCFLGYRAGAVHSVASIIALSAAFAFASPIGMLMAPLCEQLTGATGLGNRFISVGTVAIGMIAGLWISIAILANGFLRRRPECRFWNYSLGFGLGGLQVVLCVFMVAGGILMLEPPGRERSLDDESSQPILAVIDTVHDSAFGSAFVVANPFKFMPGLTKVEQLQRSVRALKNPKQIKQMIRHQSIQDLRTRPDVQMAVNKLNADPNVQLILDKGSTIGPAEAILLLNHPAVLELMDQPGFVQDATDAFVEARDATELK